MPTTQTSPSPSHRPNSPSNGLVNGLTLCTAIVISALSVQHWFDRYTYRQGEAAYRRGDCDIALSHFQKLANAERIWDVNDYQTRSSARITECNAFLEITGQTLTPPAQLLAYGSFADRFDNSPLVKLLQERSVNLVATTDLTILAERPICDRLDELTTGQLIPAASLPAFWLTCGQTYAAESHYGAAIAAYQKVLQDDGDHEITSQAEMGLAQVLLAQAKAEGSGELSKPAFSGYAQDGTTVVAIRNDSPEHMRIVFSGPDPRFEAIAPCETCQTYTDDPPESCPNQGPVATFTLEPGDYEVLVRSVSDPTVNPFTGEWLLTEGQEYNSCFYLVHNPSPTE